MQEISNGFPGFGNCSWKSGRFKIFRSSKENVFQIRSSAKGLYIHVVEQYVIYTKHGIYHTGIIIIVL